MAEDRMLNDEILLGLIKANSGGGGGGTTDYEDLENLPQIGGVELKGNKSLADLGIASAQSVSNITNGESINNFAGVETALTNKVDKVDGKGLSTNDYTDADKAIVGGVTAALAAKQDALIAGDYIQFDGNEISVNRNIEVDNVDYNIKYVNNNTASITKSKDGQVISTQNYDWGIYATSIDGLFNFGGASSSIGFVWRITLIKDSTTHSAGYSVDFKTNDTTMDVTESFPEQDISGYKLIIKSEMDTALATKQNILTFDDTPTDGSNNPVKSNGIYDALATKQNATDNNLDTEAKTIVGAINEHEGDIVSLKSGLTTLDTEVNGDATVYPYADVITIEDAIPANLAECNVKIEPVQDLHGYDHPWVGGAGDNKMYLNPSLSFPIEKNGITITSDGNNGVYLNGTSTGPVQVISIFKTDTLSGQNTICKLASDDNTGVLYAGNSPSGNYTSYTYGYDTVTGNGSWRLDIYISQAGRTFNNLHLQPMVIMGNSHPTEYIPYENICPIIGHTEVDVHRTGENLAFDTISGKNINASGVIINADFDLKVARVTSGVTYTAYTDDSSSVYAFYSASPASGSASYNNSRTEATVSNSCFEFTAPIDGYIAYRTNVGYARTECVESSKNNQYTIALGDTIYGGTVDFDSGVMTVTHGFAEFDGGEDEEWFASSTNGYQTTISDCVDSSFSDSYCICNRFEKGSVAYDDGKCGISHKKFCIGDSSLSKWADITALKTWLASNPLQVCYELATPFTIQLTPQQIQLLKGTNTLTASTGQISVTVNGVSGAIGAVQTQVNATDAAVAELAANIAEQLPTAPTTDGAYVLTVTVADGTPTYSWESAT